MFWYFTTYRGRRLVRVRLQVFIRWRLRSTSCSRLIVTINSLKNFAMHTPSSKLTVYHDTGLGKHRLLINLSELAVSFGEHFSATLLGMYVLSGEDCTCAYKGKGRCALIKLEKNPRCHKLCLQFGEDWSSWKSSPACCTDRTASLRWMASVPNPCVRSWVRIRNSLPNLRSTWLAFLPATLL